MWRNGRACQANAQRWIRFQNSFNIEQVFLSLRGLPCGVGGGPDFALEHIVDHRNRLTQPQDIPH